MSSVCIAVPTASSVCVSSRSRAQTSNATSSAPTNSIYINFGQAGMKEEAAAPTQTVDDLLEELGALLVQKKYRAASSYAVNVLRTFENKDKGVKSVFGTLRLVLLGCVACLASIYEGGGHDYSQAIRAGQMLIEKVEIHCGGGALLATVLGKPLPFAQAEGQPILDVAFQDAAMRNGYLEHLGGLICALYALLNYGRSLQHSMDRDDSKRQEVCAFIEEASCWAGMVPKNSTIDMLLQALHSSVEGNWQFTLNQVDKAIGKLGSSSPNLPAMRTIKSTLELLVGQVPTEEEGLRDIQALAARCGLLEGRPIMQPSLQPPLSLGGLLELADCLFVMKKFSESLAIVNRCEILISGSHTKHIRLERCGVRNYQSELLYQKGRIHHYTKNDFTGAAHMYESSLSYCSHHLASLYQLTRIKPATRSLAALESAASPESCKSIKTLNTLRQIIAQETYTTAQVDEVVGIADSVESIGTPADCEFSRLIVECLIRMTSRGCGTKAVAQAGVKILYQLFSLSAASVSEDDQRNIIAKVNAGDNRSELYSHHNDNGVIVTMTDSINKTEEDDDDLSHEEEPDQTADAMIDTTDAASSAAGPLCLPNESDIITVVLARRSVPIDWVISYAKLRTFGGQHNCAVWNVIRRFSRSKNVDKSFVAEIGTMTSLFAGGHYDKLHNRLKKTLRLKNNEINHSRELVIIRVLHHIVRAELQVARQVIERGLSYVHQQVVATGGQLAAHWETYGIYADLLVLTRLGSHRSPLKCKTRQILEGIFKKDTKRRRDDMTAGPMPNYVRSRIQTLIAWMLVLQGRKLRILEKSAQPPGSSRTKFHEAKNVGMQALQAQPDNWRAAYVIAEACKGLHEYVVGNKIFTLVGDFVARPDCNVSWKIKDWLQDSLMKETAYSLASIKPAPIASQGKLIRTVQSIVSSCRGSVTDFLVKLAAAVKDPKLADIVFKTILKHMNNRTPSQVPIKLVNACALVGTIACLERAKDVEAMKDPKILSELIADTDKVAEAYRYVLTEKQAADGNSMTEVYVPSGKQALSYLVRIDQPIIGPLYDDEEVSETSPALTKDILEDLPRSESLRRKLEQDVEALSGRLRELHPLVRHEYATACAVREERLRENAKILEDFEQAQLPEVDDSITYGFGGAT